jgi:hypothetical protein
MTRPAAHLALGAAALAAVTASAFAEPLPKDERERACWLQYTRERTRIKLTEPTLVDFANLRDGYTVRSPFQIDFAIKGMGVIPAGKPHPKAGHHHILIDTPLPTVVTDQIPFNNNHRHFGKGQTGTTVELPPGPHTLRLLFADHEHRPYFVYSPEIKVTVSGARSNAPVSIDAGCPAWYQEEVSRPRPAGNRALITNLRDGEPVVSPFAVRFAVDGFGVAPRGQAVAGTGHFMLDVMQGGRSVQAVDLSGGATQANLFLAPGAYTLRLRFMDDGRTKELVPAAEVGITVTAQERG